MTIEEAIKHCNNKAEELNANGCHKCADEHEQLAYWLKELDDLKQLRIKKKVIKRSWCSCICPTCGESLSEDKGDGYYNHLGYLKVCQNEECLQRLDWD